MPTEIPTLVVANRILIAVSNAAVGFDGHDVMTDIQTNPGRRNAIMCGLVAMNTGWCVNAADNYICVAIGSSRGRGLPDTRLAG